MDEYVPEGGSLSAALLAEVANGQARDLRAARARVAELEAENERLRAAMHELVVQVDRAPTLLTSDSPVYCRTARPRHRVGP